MASDRYTRLPRPSVIHPSSNACRNRFSRLRARLLDLVEEHDRAGVVLQLIRQDSAALTADDTARHANQLVDRRAAALVLGHIDADHLLLVAEQELGDGLGQLRFPDAGRSEKHQHAIGPIEAVLERALVQHEPVRERLHRLLLTDHTLLQPRLDLLETIADIAEHHVARHLRGVCDHLDYVGRPDVPPPINLCANRSGVEPANDLVRQVKVSLVPRRHLERRLDRVVHEAHGIVALEPRPEVVEDPPRRFERRLGHVHRPEAPCQRLVFQDGFLVLAQRGCTDHTHLAAREHALEDVGGVRRSAQRRAGADQRVRFVDEEDQVRPLLDLADDVLDSILEHAAERGAGDHRVHLQIYHLAVAQPNWH